MNSNIGNINIDQDLQNLWHSFKRRWKIGFLLFSGTVILSSIAAFMQRPEYIASGKLLFKVNQTSILTGIGEELNNFNSLENDANPTSTEIEVLKSYPIAEKALASIKEDESINLDILPKDLLLKIGAEPIVGTDVVVVSYKGSNEKEGMLIVNQLMNAYIENNLANSRSDIASAQEIVQQQIPKATQRVKNREKALLMFKQKHQLVAFDEESRGFLTRRDEVQKEIDAVKLQLQEEQNQSQILKQQLGMDLSEAIALRNINQSPKIQEALRNLSVLQSEVVQKQEFFADNNPVMASLNSQIQSLTNFLENEVQKIPNPSNRKFTIADLLDNERPPLQQDLIISLAQAERLVPSLQRKLAQLEQMKTVYQANLQNLPKIENEYRDLQLQLETAQSNYRNLLSSLEDIRVAEPQNLDNVRVIESAQSIESYHLSFIFLALGFAVGPVLAISVMSVSELKDKSIRTIEQLKEIFSYPILGTVPDLLPESESFSLTKLMDRSIVQYLPKSHSQLESNNHSSSSNVMVSPRSIGSSSSQYLDSALVINSFSMLEARLATIREKRAVRTIVISSALPEEGKSKVVHNLALNMASIGKKVMIIDANLHEPSQHKIWQVENAQGLSDVILNGKKLDKLIHRVRNNIDLLTTGRLPESPYDVINSREMKFLIEYSEQTYDCVLVDSSSLSGNMDALNLGKITDGMLLVTRLGLLTYPKAKEHLNLLETTDQNVIGIVVNGVSQ